ncbi:conserved hypothetical protein [Aspergillus terreus NIH2624]|uniref:LIM zinc-binding domain-containing protein n=1 Tax=Aspergillus terreus (strain NIH 2624 / FGSC A1156) TaxID=341663 RepID=Q0CT72_ASPTN|nr:uncharacterized protein ATEG_03112 [Aspergillus terreus NIH2624]EAU36386.1 conserved hypothetical protein [Aspergillus terreus NIH2624]
MSTYGHERVPSAAPAAEIERPRATSALSNHRPMSFRGSIGSSAGRPLVQEPRAIPGRQAVSPTRSFSRPSPPSPNALYRESAQRRKEKEEARSLRDALQEMDLQDDIRLHNAAQDEATELVWMHLNPGVPYKNPYAPYRNPDMEKLRQSPEKSSHSHTKSLGSSGSQRESHLPVFKRFSTGQSGGGSPVEKPAHHEQQTSPGKDDTSPRKQESLRRKVNFALPREDTHRSTKDDCGLGLTNVGTDLPKNIFRNPTDQIYEEPKDSPKEEDDRPLFSRSDSSALRSRPRNILRGSRPLPARSGNSIYDKLSRFEIHKNPPSQSRDPGYTTNDTFSQPKVAEEEPLPTKDGVEIRSDDIRAATSKKLKDRSTKLPMPTAVSDRAGRPIVSFDPQWKPAEAESPPKRQSAPQPPPAPPAPTIEVSEAAPIPVINLPDDKEPTISEMEESSRDQTRNQPLPAQQRHSHLSNSSPKKSRPAVTDRWLSTYTRSGVPTAKCESCSLPIAGRIVTAAGSRFHPECFVCHHCNTALECVAFYEEPEAKRNERLADTSPDDEEAHSLRFYCHLDFHELFSPRCKSCKTPIEGEVVVACGAEWHVGHFFCAECGDPFGHDTPFVEKDGFAWCLQCHSRRTAPRCLGCKKPVLDDVVISAVGGQWHDACFVCHECGEGFGPDGRYFVREGEPKRTAKGRIIGGPVQLAVSVIDMVDYGEGIRYKHYIDFLHQVHMSQAGVCLTYWVVAGNLHSQERVWPVMCMIRN